MDRASDSGSEGWGFESLLAYQRGVLIELPFELFVNIFQKLHVGVQLFPVLKLWIFYDRGKLQLPYKSNSLA